jgi:hypothetical protein
VTDDEQDDQNEDSDDSEEYDRGYDDGVQAVHDAVSHSESDTVAGELASGPMIGLELLAADWSIASSPRRTREASDRAHGTRSDFRMMSGEGRVRSRLSRMLCWFDDSADGESGVSQ